MANSKVRLFISRLVLNASRALDMATNSATAYTGRQQNRTRGWLNAILMLSQCMHTYCIHSLFTQIHAWAHTYICIDTYMYIQTCIHTNTYKIKLIGGDSGRVKIG